MSDPWFVDAFRTGYLGVYAHRDDAAAGAEAAFAATLLGDVARVLDAGCGAWRHARALAARGFIVTGLDLSLDLLREAATLGGGPRYVRGDLRALPFGDGAFGGVLSFFTSFGYFDDAGNARQLAALRRVTRRRGRLVLDFLNAALVRAALVPRSERESAGHTIIEERAIRAGRVEKDVTVIAPGGARRAWRESVRLYSREDLGRLLGTAGYDVLAVHGDLCGGPFEASSSARCVLVGEAA